MMEIYRLLLPWAMTCTTACPVDAPAPPKQWPGAHRTLEALADYSANVVTAESKGKAKVRARRGQHRSTAMALPGGGTIRGGGMLTFAECEQTFRLAKTLHGEAKLGERVLKYDFIEKAEGHPLPSPEKPIPTGEKVILLLHKKGHILKALPDTPENREAVRKAYRRKDPTKKSKPDSH